MKRHTSPNLECLESKALLSALAYSISTNQSSYAAGQPVEMTFQETNDSSKPITVEEGPSIDGFDVLQGGHITWRSNSGVNPMYLALDTLQPGQSLTLTATWNGVPSGSSTPASGTFVVANQLNQGTTASFSISPGTTRTTPPPTTPVNAPEPTNSGTSPQSPTPSPTPTAPPSGGDPVSPVAVNVTPNPAGHRGRAVRLTMRLTDVGNTPVTLPANAAADFTVIEGSTPVWHRATSATAVRPRTIRPGQTIEYSVAWKPKAHAAETSADAAYTVVANLGAYSGSTMVAPLG